MTTGPFPHDNFSSVYWIFTKLDHMIALWKGKKPIYFGVNRSKVKVTITINIIFYHLIIYIDGRILWCTHFLFYINLMQKKRKGAKLVLQPTTFQSGESNCPQLLHPWSGVIEVQTADSYRRSVVMSVQIFSGVSVAQS